MNMLGVRGPEWPRPRKIAPAERSQERVGINTQIQLLDMVSYRERVLPAIHAFHEHADPQPLVRLLGIAAEHAPEEHQWGAPDLYGDRQFRRIKDELDRVLDPNKRQELSRELARRHNQWLSRNAGPHLLTRAEALAAAASLERSASSREVAEEMIRSTIAPALVEFLCIKWNEGVNPNQELRWSPLLPYLSSHSDFMHLIFAGMVNGRHLEISTGESTDLFSHQDLETTRSVLNNMARPTRDDWLEAEFKNFETLVERALQDPNLALGLTIA